MARKARDAFPTGICKQPTTILLCVFECSNGCDCRKEVEISEGKQVGFKDWVVGSKAFTRTEKAALDVDSAAAFKDYWEETNSALGDFDRSHEKGCGLRSKRYQYVAADAQRFVNEFSPIVQIVKDFGAPYGAVAVGTMSLLFAVSVNPAVFDHFVRPANIARRWPGTSMKSRKA